ncbi:dephospho-CoA kinase [Aminipila luticellarii]|nr:dephospho-CoA kinase [Aminipila luticellarii]
MKIIGLTGGIGSGKSTVSRYLSQKGYSIIDADEIARQIVKPDSTVLKKLVGSFGSSILNGDGSLNRSRLAELAFTHKEEKAKLDQIMLQEIVRVILEKIQTYEKSGKEIIFIDAPLLFEAGLDKESNEIWVVDAADEVRVERVIKRDDSTREAVLARIENQMNRQEQYQRANHILNNSTTQKALYEQIDKLLKN